MRKKIIIIGAGDLCLDLIETIENDYGKKMKIVGLLDNNKTEKIFNYKIIGKDLSCLKDKTKYSYIVAIADNNTREKIMTELFESNLNVVSIISKSSFVSKSCELGEGVYIGKGVYVNSQSKIGDGVVIRDCVFVAHGCKIRDFVYISPKVSLAGNVNIGKKSFLGINSCVIPNKKTGIGCVIGAGAVVIKNVYSFTKVAGVPAKEIY